VLLCSPTWVTLPRCSLTAQHCTRRARALNPRLQPRPTPSPGCAPPALAAPLAWPLASKLQGAGPAAPPAPRARIGTASLAQTGRRPRPPARPTKPGSGRRAARCLRARARGGGRGRLLQVRACVLRVRARRRAARCLRARGGRRGRRRVLRVRACVRAEGEGEEARSALPAGARGWARARAVLQVRACVLRVSSRRRAARVAGSAQGARLTLSRTTCAPQQGVRGGRERILSRCVWWWPREPCVTRRSAPPRPPRTKPQERPPRTRSAGLQLLLGRRVPSAQREPGSGHGVRASAAAPACPVPGAACPMEAAA